MAKKIILFGVLFFLITIALVLQIVPAGNVIMADRYTYLPYVGLMFIMGHLFNYSLIESKLKTSKRISVAGVILFILTCSYYSKARTKVWHDSLTFWNDAIQKSPDAALPYSNRAAIFIKNEKFENAIMDLNKAIAIRPNYVSARFNRGLLLNKTGKYNEAISDFNFVLQNNPRDLVSVYMERGIANINCKNFKEAYEDFTTALKYDPTILMANYYRGLALYSSGMFSEAITELGYLLRRDPQNCRAYYVRALSFYEIKNFAEASLDITAAQKLGCQIDPKFANELNSKLK
ncbi:MAG: tetratricopeptide repeat protein [Sphingobacteriaceae bacterium]|nr:tetratricopeptide repeat protein [Sphingobacteriaceae bacterium]